MSEHLALGSCVLEDLQAASERVTALEQHRMLLRAGQPIDHVYFVDSGLVSLRAVGNDGRGVETGMIAAGGWSVQTSSSARNGQPQRPLLGSRGLHVACRPGSF